MSDAIIASDKPSSSSPFTPPSRIICRVCQKHFSQYTCPRCNARYCSLKCYKSHNLRCTESFMQENVVEEFRQIQPDDETKQKMLDILKRFHTEDDSDSMDEDDSSLSEEIIQKILAGVQVNIDDLSAEEKRRFQRAVASGELSKMIESWDPWWLKPSAKSISLGLDGSQLVQPLVKQQALCTEIPPGPETPLPPVSKLSSTQPSPLLAVHLVDIIYSYCFTIRLYNGDWQSDAVGVATAVLSISSVLGKGGQPETMLEAVSHCLEQTCSAAYKHIGGFQFGLALLDDVTSLLLLGGSALICLLCDLQRLIQAGERELKLEKPKKLRMVEMTSKLKHAKKKVYFLMCWVHEQPEEAWSSLAAIVRAEKASALDYEGSDKRFMKTVSKADARGKVLIEEIQ